jgi:hypothetical protein
MNVRWTHGRRTHLWVTLLLLPALACRMLVPPGFMPGTDANHVPTMQMCHGAGPLPQGVQAPAKGDGRQPGDPAQHESPCAFAAAGTAAPPPITLPILVGAATPDAVPSPPERAVVHRTQHRANAPRAPPVAIDLA